MRCCCFADLPEISIFYRKSENVCIKKSVRKSTNQNLKSAIRGFVDRFAEVPSSDFAFISKLYEQFKHNMQLYRIHYKRPEGTLMNDVTEHKQNLNPQKDIILRDKV